MASVTYLGSPQLPSRLVAKLVAAKRAWERVVSMAITITRGWLAAEKVVIAVWDHISVKNGLGAHLRVVYYHIESGLDVQRNRYRGRVPGHLHAVAASSQNAAGKPAAAVGLPSIYRTCYRTADLPVHLASANSHITSANDNHHLSTSNCRRSADDHISIAADRDRSLLHSHHHHHGPLRSRCFYSFFGLLLLLHYYIYDLCSYDCLRADRKNAACVVGIN